MKNITKVQALTMAVELAKGNKPDLQGFEMEDLQDKLQAMNEQEQKIVSRKKGKKTISKTAKEKAENMDKVRKLFSEMEEPQALTLAEIGSAIGLDGATPQKIAAIMKPLIDNEEFTKDKKDKKTVFKVA